MPRRLGLLAAALCCSALAAGAQDRGRLILAPGTQVRATWRAPSGETLTGHADGIVGDTLLLAEPARRIPLADLSALEVRGGRDRARGATIGAVALGVVTGVGGGIDYSRGNIGFGDLLWTIAENVSLGAAVGALLAPTGWLKLPLPGR